MKLLPFLAVVLLSSILPAHACNVPVYRYALERWPTDSYTVIVFVGDTLTQEDRDTIALLEQSSKPSGGHANYVVQTVDVGGQMPEAIATLWNTMKDRELPCMTLLYPGFQRVKVPVWTGRLTAEAIAHLVDSPARKEIARRIIDGESAVWILVESGDRTLDDAAARMLDTEIKEATDLLELPTQDMNANDFVPIREDGPALKVAYSVVRVSRNDPGESVLVHMLMKTEPDLEDYAAHPMAFPVYGRGRVLYALVGDGIDKRNVIEACSFVIGPCSCQIKELNPGVDLLMNVDWESSFDRLVISDTELPPLVGLSELVSDAVAGAGDETASKSAARATIQQKPQDSRAGGGSAATGASAETAKNGLRVSPESADAATVRGTQSDEDNGSGHVLRNILAALAIIFTATVVTTLTIIKPWKRNGR